MCVRVYIYAGGGVAGGCYAPIRPPLRSACPALPTQVIEAFKLLTSDKQVKAILVNIFGRRPRTLTRARARACRGVHVVAGFLDCG